jgi:glycosyltransferase involved in cell wall biosynthesis
MSDVNSSDSSQPLVSVVIPAYNASNFIAEAVESALSQTYAPVEVIIVDDGSTDDTVAVVDRRHADDARVRLFRQENAGPSAARNRGIREARGEFIQLLDSDEVLLPIKIEQSYRLFCEQPEIAAVYGHGLLVEADGVTPIVIEQPLLPSGDVFCAWFNGRMAGGNYSVTGSFMIRRSVLLEVGGFDETMSYAEDVDLWLKIAARYPFAALEERLVIGRRLESGLHRNRLGIAKGRLQALINAEKLDKWRECVDDAGYHRLLASRWQVVAMRYWELDKRVEARQAFDEAIRLHPPQAKLRRIYRWMTWLFSASVVEGLWNGLARLRGHRVKL